MRHAYEIEVTDGPLDFGLCVRTGQMFRWREIKPGRFVGADGDAAYRVETAVGLDAFAGARGTGMNRDPRRDALRSPSALACRQVAIRLRVRSTHPEEAFRSLLRLDQDDQAVRAEIVRRDERLAPFLDATAGLRLLRPAGRVETLFAFILSANNHVPRITSLVHLLAERGEPLAEGLRAFPTIACLARLEEHELRAERFGYRAASVVATARHLHQLGGEAYLETLSRLPFAALVRELATWRGIGAKVAECVALFAYDRGEAVPMDTHVWRMLSHLGYAEGAFTTARAKVAAERFRDRMGPYAARAQQALFYDDLLNWRSRLT